MTLGGALQIGRSGLLASQAAIEVAGQNLANVATRGYHRQAIRLAPAGEQMIRHGVFLGRGVQVQEITRQISEALEGRVRGSIADQSSSAVRSDVLSQIEALQNELSDIDLSSQLGKFFNGWSELANTPLDNSVRTIVIQQGQSLASFVRNLRSGLVDLRTAVDRDLDAGAAAANDILTRLEAVNAEIALTDQGTGGAHALRDQRDVLLAELSEHLDISIVEQRSGVVDVFVGSLPIVLDGKSRGLEVRRQTVNGESQVKVVIKADGSPIQPRSGKLGALAAARQEDVVGAIETLDRFANALIYEVNRVHSQGQGTTGFASVTGTSKVADANAALNDAAANLKFPVGHGSFELHVTQKSSGQRVTSTLAIDLDGIGADTSLADLAARLDAVANVSASVTADGRLQIASESGDFEVGFGADSSGVLAALGINSYFTGSDAGDIAVHPSVLQSPARLAVGRGHVTGDNRNALALAALRDQRVDTLGGMSLTESWNRHVGEYAVRLGQANQRLEADAIVRENLEAQQQAVSGVNADEEAIDLLSFQRAYQGSARFLTVVDEMLETLLGLI